jgi:hypothetical protein
MWELEEAQLLSHTNTVAGNMPKSYSNISALHQSSELGGFCSLLPFSHAKFPQWPTLTWTHIQEEYSGKHSSD